MEPMREPMQSILKEFPVEAGSLIPILQKTQEAFGYISPQAVERISRFLKLTENEIFGVASFYSQFRFIPKGRHSITVCLGTACHVRSGGILLEALERHLEIQTGECTADGRFDLEAVACLGCCALAPVVKIDGDIYGNMAVIKIKELLEKYE
ncbi:MAG: NAD(P)H-dependent oxidoreductase subunit E [Candidatus Aminicenantes bacterium]|nr:NAD(P)H-dependent oxidoreductase subunit E [Candidatus Aminicenantes bacterium]